MRKLKTVLALLGLLVLALALGGCEEFWPLTAGIAVVDRATGSAPLAVQFLDISYGPIVSRAWDFGDPASGASNASSLESPTHTFVDDGVYTVTLVVYDADGWSSRATVTVTVVNPLPEPRLSVTPDHGPAPLTVTFDLSASYDPAGIVPTPTGSIVFYSLDFGDGSVPTTGTSVGVPVSHTYTTPGRRSATLSVIDDDGAAATATRVVIVEGVTASIPSPGPDPVGLAYDGANLWVSDSTTKLIYKVRPSDGFVLAEFAAPGEPSTLGVYRKGIVPNPEPSGTPAGLAWQDGSLWVACSSDGRLYKLNPLVPPTEPGHVLAVIESTDFAAFGLAYGAGALWVSDLGRARIFKVDPWTASILGSIPAPGASPTGLGTKGLVAVAPTGVAWADGSLWVTDGTSLARINPATGAVLATTPAPGDTPVGLAFDGLHIWVCDPDGENPGRIDRLVVP